MSAADRPDAGDVSDILDTGEAGGLAIRGSSLRVLGYVGGALLTLVSAPLLIRHLGVVDFGRYVTATSLVALVAGVSEAGLTAIAIREYTSLRASERGDFMRRVAGAKIAITLVGIALATAFAAIAGYGTELVIGTLIGGFGLLLAALQSIYQVPLAVGLRLGWQTTIDLVRVGVSVLLIVALILVGADVLPFLAVPVAATFLILLLTMWLVRGTIPFRPALRPSRWLGVVRETLALATANVLGTLYFRLVIVLMPLLTTPLQTGYFATSYRLTEVLTGIPGLLVGTMFPILSRAARDDESRLGYAMQRLFDVALIGGVWMTLTTALGAELAIAILGGDEAAPAAGVLRLQALSITMLFLSLVWLNGLLALRQHADMLRASAVGLVSILVLTLVLVPPLDAEGGALAAVFGETCLMLAAGALLLRSRPALKPTFETVPKVLVAAAAAVAVGFLPGLPSVVVVIAASVVYFGVLALLGGIPGELRAAFVGRLPSALTAEGRRTRK